MNVIKNKNVHAVKLNLQDRRQGEGGKALLVRQEQVKDAEKSGEMASNRGELL